MISLKLVSKMKRRCYVRIQPSTYPGHQELILEDENGVPIDKRLVDIVPLGALTNEVTAMATLKGYPVEGIRWK
jgi:hypothetical protein